MKKILPQSALLEKILHFLLIITFLLPLTACHKTESASATSAPAMPPANLPPPKVKIAQPLSQQVTDWDEYTGRIEAVETVQVQARVSGYLEKVNFKAGARVNKGDLLFVLDDRPFKAQLNHAVAELNKAKAELELAKNDFTRAENLLKAKAISAEEYDGRQKGLQKTQAAVESVAAQVESAKLNLQFTQVHAPIGGRISRELITAGNVVSGNEIGATPLATIVSTDPVYVSVDMDERAMLTYQREAQKQGKKLVGSALELALADEEGFLHSGELDYVAPLENSASGTVNVRGVFSNKDELLRPGFFARLRIQGGAAYPALLLPDSAIGTDQADRFVWVMDKNKKVSHRKVLPGKKRGELRVIAQGLQAEDWVVLDGLQKLKPDSVIAPEKITLTPATAE